MVNLPLRPVLLPAQRTHEKTKRSDVRDHQQGYVDDRDQVGGAKLPRHRGKPDVNCVVIVHEQVDDAHEIESDDEQSEQRAYPDAEECQHGQDARREVWNRISGGMLVALPNARSRKSVMATLLGL